MKPDVLICTVGTSLCGHLASGPLSDAWRRRAYRTVGSGLRDLSPDARECGAEINSIHDLRRRGFVERLDGIELCVSDTEAGRDIGRVLEAYYEGDVNVRIHEVDDLSDEDPDAFRNRGLRNLARIIGGIVRNAGSPRRVALNATGGYKAQIAIAVLVGQALEIDVFYKHEKFAEIIAFPPMPISFDYTVLARHGDLLALLEREGVVRRGDYDRLEESARTLLEEVDDLWSLAPIGQIYLEGFRQRHPAARTLPPDAEAKMSAKLRDDHYPLGFEDYMNRVIRDTPYVKTAYSASYDRQKSMIFGFREGLDDKIIGEYIDKNGFGGRFVVITTAETALQRAAVVDDLNARWGSKS